MEQKIKPYARRIAIMRTLHKHGPLSVVGLKKIIHPPMESRRITDSLRRLYKRGYLVKRFDSLPQNVGHFYQLTYRESARAEITKLLGIENQLFQPQIRDQELYHSQQCAIWATKFKRFCPEAKVLREYCFLQDDQALTALLSKPHELKLKPDILLISPKGASDRPVTIAIEIECSRKTDARLEEKLRKYAKETTLDGVLYLCDWDSLPQILNRIYNSTLRSNLRVGHYSANFLMFSDGLSSDDYQSISMYNADKKNVFFHDWIHFLTTHHRNLRRDSKINLSAEAR